MSYEIVKERIKTFDRDNIIHFLKWATQYNILDGTKINQMANFEQIFPFASEQDKRQFKKVKNTEFALTWFKENIKENKKSYTPKAGYKSKIEKITGLLSNNVTNNELQAYVDKLIPYSFILHAKIELKSPYFLKDDDEFYLIQNPCLKEKVFKVPMVRGSGWKGVLANAFKELFEKDCEDKRTKIRSFLRIFGAGSDSIKVLESYLLDKSKDLEKAKEKFLEFMLFELGLKVHNDLIKKVKKVTNKDELKNLLAQNLSQKLMGNQKELPLEFQTHKGRAIFYPTYFDRFSLEIINPHSRKTRAGTGPVHYEVVPKGSEGTLQIVYIPFDGILKKNGELEEEVKQDIEFLIQAIEKAQEIGIGAKEKLGWGRFRLKNKRFCVNRAIGLEGINDGKHCEVNNEQ